MLPATPRRRTRSPSRSPPVRSSASARVRGEKQRQAKGINDNLVVRMLAAAGNRRVDLRNKALLTVAYTAMCRRSVPTFSAIAEVQRSSAARRFHAFVERLT
jgi:hypothetical protein